MKNLKKYEIVVISPIVALLLLLAIFNLNKINEDKITYYLDKLNIEYKVNKDNKQVIVSQNEIIKKFGKPYFQDKYNLKYKNIEFTFNSLNEIKQIVILNKIYVLRKDITINSYIQDFYKAYKEYSPINNQVILDKNKNNIIISCETKNNKITKIIITT